MTDLRVLQIGKQGLAEVYASNHFDESATRVHPHTELEPTKKNLRAHFDIQARGAHHYARNKGIETKIVICGVGDPTLCNEGESIPQRAVIVAKSEGRKLGRFVA